MDHKGMKGPLRPAPSAPGFQNRYSPVTNWNDDPFGTEVFEPNPQPQKKKPPPRPPPPKVNAKKQPEVPAKPSHFIRKPTVLSTLLSRKSSKSNVTQSQSMQIQANTLNRTDILTEVNHNSQKLFPRCEPKPIQTGALIDLSSPPSSPTFTTRSSSDGLSVDSFGSDATSSTNQHHPFGGGNASQAESGFEDDFDLFLNTRKISKEDTLDDFSNFDPFSPPVQKPSIAKKPVIQYSDNGELSKGRSLPVRASKGPTIIRAKPARPKPPDNAAILKSALGNTLPTTLMNINMSNNPIQKINSGYDYLAVSSSDWEEVESSPEREASPPMPTVPPPPPPPEATLDDDLDLKWGDDLPKSELTMSTSIFGDGSTMSIFSDAKSANLFGDDLRSNGLVFSEGLRSEVPTFTRESSCDDKEPYAVALYDYYGEHQDDLSFNANAKIKLIRRMNEEWFFGALRNGVEGVFPANYVEIKIPLPGEVLEPPPILGKATALYDFEPSQPGDLRFSIGDSITVISQLSDEWYFGECKGLKGQFPANYVNMH